MSDARFEGVGPALITPMHVDGSLDLDTFARHVENVVRAGVHFLVPCGTTGESATLSRVEQARVISTCVEVAAGRVPVMAGAGTNDTAAAAELAAGAARAGADAVLTVSPYYNKPTLEGLVRHYRTVAKAGGLPVYVYNVPGRTGANLSPTDVLTIAAEVEGVAGVKEASGSVSQVMTILRERPEGFTVLSGEDHLTYALMAMGAEGVISVVANEAPGEMARMCGSLLARDAPHEARAALDLHWRLLPLIEANFLETNPIPVKTAMGLLGLGEAHFRLPLCEMDPDNRDRLREALEGAGLLPRTEAR
ncbi:MAG TPA: 4-hydroxy-tetrahydrodipicolinate synthase [Longimicrobiales bacterium]|jgi:4-hydroxy-tetrahydrodipicolinate synthase